MKWKVLGGLLVVLFCSAMRLPIRSVQPLQLEIEGHLTNVCTAFSIHESRGFWMTANHCYRPDLTFRGQTPTWVAYDEGLDLAVFQGTPAPAIKFAPKAPEVGDDVALIGYPFGALDPLAFFGKFSAVFARLDAETSGQVYNLTSFAGDSGAPILDASSRVIGVNQNSNGHGLAIGVTYKALRDFGQKYWEP